MSVIYSRSMYESLRKKDYKPVSGLAQKERNSSIKKASAILRKPEADRTDEDREILTKYSGFVGEATLRLEKRQKQKERLQEIEDCESVLNEKCVQLAKAVAKSKHLIVYTGAGISTAARIPDYRGTSGIWTLLQQGKDIGSHDLTQAEPTYTHMALSQLHRQGKLKYIVSQNCDGLHLRSGLPRKVLSEVHGNMYIEVCRKCRPAVEYWRLFDVTENTARYSHKTLRRCYKCNTSLVDSIVHFGERGSLAWPLNWAGASKAAEKADMILCIGSSLKVLKKYPWLWSMDKPVKRRPQLFIVNLQWTPKDCHAALKIHGKCDVVMQKIMKHLKIIVPEYEKVKDPIFSHATRLCTEEEHTTNLPCLKFTNDELVMKMEETPNDEKLKTLKNDVKTKNTPGTSRDSDKPCPEETKDFVISKEKKNIKAEAQKSENKDEVVKLEVMEFETNHIKQEPDEKVLDGTKEVKIEIGERVETLETITGGTHIKLEIKTEENIESTHSGEKDCVESETRGRETTEQLNSSCVNSDKDEGISSIIKETMELVEQEVKVKSCSVQIEDISESIYKEISAKYVENISIPSSSNLRSIRKMRRSTSNEIIEEKHKEKTPITDTGQDTEVTSGKHGKKRPHDASKETEPNKGKISKVHQNGANIQKGVTRNKKRTEQNELILITVKPDQNLELCCGEFGKTKKHDTQCTNFDVNDLPITIVEEELQKYIQLHPQLCSNKQPQKHTISQILSPDNPRLTSVLSNPYQNTQGYLNGQYLSYLQQLQFNDYLVNYVLKNNLSSPFLYSTYPQLEGTSLGWGVSERPVEETLKTPVQKYNKQSSETKINKEAAKKTEMPKCSFCFESYKTKTCQFYMQRDAQFKVDVVVCDCCDVSDDDNSEEEIKEEERDVKDDKGAESEVRGAVNPGWYGKGYRTKKYKKRR